MFTKSLLKMGQMEVWLCASGKEQTQTEEVCWKERRQLLDSFPEGEAWCTEEGDGLTQKDRHFIPGSRGEERV